jgi:hypothetical protein
MPTLSFCSSVDAEKLSVCPILSRAMFKSCDLLSMSWPLFLWKIKVDVLNCCAKVKIWDLLKGGMSLVGLDGKWIKHPQCSTELYTSGAGMALPLWWSPWSLTPPLPLPGVYCNATKYLECFISFFHEMSF